VIVPFLFIFLQIKSISKQISWVNIKAH